MPQPPSSDQTRLQGRSFLRRPMSLTPPSTTSGQAVADTGLLAAFRRALIAARYRPGQPVEPTITQVLEVDLWRWRMSRLGPTGPMGTSETEATRSTCHLSYLAAILTGAPATAPLRRLTNIRDGTGWAAATASPGPTRPHD